MWVDLNVSFKQIIKKIVKEVCASVIDWRDSHQQKLKIERFPVFFFARQYSEFFSNFLFLKKSEMGNKWHAAVCIGENTSRQES